ncbi:peptidyl-tRNA hydrolase 2, mitochondrial-like [Homalodisca vitripennis]|uniref:peptidyl-tRNA hydrolase 2, mitochondrial-like n=1 Tax=Homalodisca vitripennis TaxID=197043 RepID=UPI001EEBCB8D|nr:peptidyl-tRNA hydrolase 2, mitochondrial-like [Homalodisca vitripennis]
MDTTRLAVSATSFVVGVVAALLVRVGLRGGFVKALTTGSSWRDMKMVMVVRSDLAIGRNNKAAAQCAHAAINCYKRALTDAPKDLRRWETQGQTKVGSFVNWLICSWKCRWPEHSMMDFGSVLETVQILVSGEAELMEVAENAQAEGLVAVVIHDSDSAIVLGIGPGPTALVDKVAGHLRLY